MIPLLPPWIVFWIRITKKSTTVTAVTGKIVDNECLSTSTDFFKKCLMLGILLS